MKHRENGFDVIAPVYDLFARLVFGNDIVKAQTEFLQHIPKEARVLVLGGGTGWILNEIFKQIEVAEVVYVDISRAMTQRAREKCTDRKKVDFVVGTLDDVRPDKVFDVIVMNFYLDLFSEITLCKHMKKVHGFTKSGGLWLIADFVNSKKTKHRLLLWIMYRFFRWVCHIEAASLPQWTNAAQSYKLTNVAERDFYNGFIKSVVYRM